MADVVGSAVFAGLALGAGAAFGYGLHWVVYPHRKPMRARLAKGRLWSSYVLGLVGMVTATRWLIDPSVDRLIAVLALTPIFGGVAFVVGWLTGSGTPTDQPGPNARELPGEAAWAAALAEFDSDARRPGLWAKAYAESNGDEARAKAAYLRFRASELAPLVDSPGVRSKPFPAEAHTDPNQ